MTDPSRRRQGLRLLAATATAVAVVGGALAVTGSSQAEVSLRGVPRASCGPGDLVETSLQGRVPTADYESGRAALGYTCNTTEVGRHGRSGGFKVQRYTDRSGRTCAYYDSTRMLGTNLGNLANETGLGVVVLDMTDPAHPVKTANLMTPAMLSPHESLLVNQERGLLAGVMGTAATAPGILDVYDISQDCRTPQHRSTTVSGVFGHESGFAPDGRTFWSAGAAGFTLTAVDLTDPRTPRTLLVHPGVVYHGLRLSDDGRTMYVADMGIPSENSILDRPGLDILDVSDVQDRRPSPQIRTLSELTWPDASIPQVAEPFHRDGRTYVLEVDEFTDWFGHDWQVDFFGSNPGAARIIDVTDPTAPFVVSNIRLQVHDPDLRDSGVLGDPGGNSVIQSYSAHYCSVPTRDQPRIAGCSMIASGLRLFDISDLTAPREIGYFNRPGANGGNALSQPAWDIERRQVWYTDADEGLFVVGLQGPAAELLRARQSCGADPTDPVRDTDGDGLSDAAEAHGVRVGQKVFRKPGKPRKGVRIGLVRTDPCRADTDGDGLSDRQEIAGSRIKRVGKRKTDPTRVDTDGDGRTDRQEIRRRTDPTRAR